MRIEDDDFEGFRVRGLWQQKGRGWRIKTWPSGQREPEHDYWVAKGQLLTVIPGGLSGLLQSEMGLVPLIVDTAEHRAILSAIAKWEAAPGLRILSS